MELRARSLAELRLGQDALAVGRLVVVND